MTDTQMDKHMMFIKSTETLSDWSEENIDSLIAMYENLNMNITTNTTIHEEIHHADNIAEDRYLWNQLKFQQYIRAFEDDYVNKTHE